MNEHPTRDPNSLALQVVLKEYEMLRLEINMFNQYRQQLMYSSALILGAIVTALATATGWLGSHHVVGVLCLMSSVLFSVGGLLFAELRWRIFRAASYLHMKTRVHVSDLCGRKGLLEWETFLGHEGPLQDWKYWLVENIGWLIFLVPATLFAIVAPYLVVKDSCANGFWDVSHVIAAVLIPLLAVPLLIWVWSVSNELRRFKVAPSGDAAGNKDGETTGP